ncbi:MAG: chemotaxis response regulator protein-glutamate methylesterase [Granulosicoccus sp.]|nr:chemotaxis response regulator protein-glutamate methylesterase [Granulosicoccus sp.]
MIPATSNEAGLSKLKVLIVDDSITLCRFLEATFMEDPELEVVGYALDPFEARDKIKSLQPDVITLDVEMPKMDGVTFLKNLMRLHPLPVVMFSSVTEVGAQATLDALEAGAVDSMPKHSARSGEDMGEYIKELVRKVKAAAQAQVFKPRMVQVATPLPDLKASRTKLHAGEALDSSIKRIIAIGASTGGPEALRHVVGPLSVLDSVLVISQHMPSNFMESFAKRMDVQSKFDIRLAMDGEELQAGRGYVAPGDKHLVLQKSADRYYWRLIDSPKVSGHRPSVDMLFDSLTGLAPKSTIAVLMTGMGEDGAKGLSKLRNSGALTIIQSKQTSVVWGMPGKAESLNAQDETLDLNQIALAINKLCSNLA